MIFLNPILLLGLPLIALPVLVHLINQRRHKSVEWGAMRFLLSARKMSRGAARLKHVSILAARMLIVAGLVFALGRPLATGWVGKLAGGKPETVIVLLDRSASMQVQDLTNGKSKLQSGLEKISDLIDVFGKTGNVVLIDSATNSATEVANGRLLAQFPNAAATDGSADISTMLQTALDYVADNQTGRTDIWICSDGQRNDWKPESGHWELLQSAFSEFSGVRFHILNFNEIPKQNYSIEIESVDQVPGNGAQGWLALDVLVSRNQDFEGAKEIPIEVTVDGARTVINAKISNRESRILGQKIPIGNSEIGWGKVELPADSNNSDNQFFFTYSKSEKIRTTIVTENVQEIEALKMICSVSPSTELRKEVTVLSPSQLNEIDWNNTAMLLWHAPLPDAATEDRIKEFVHAGRSVFFFPPVNSRSDNEYAGISWGDWKKTDAESQAVGFWKNDFDILGRTREGDALPVENLKVFRYRQIVGAERVLASLENGSTLLSRAISDSGAAYFCSTLPAANYSNLAQNGVVAFAMMHRSIDGVATSLGNAAQFVAGSPAAEQTKNMKQIASVRPSLSEQNPFMAGVYSNDEKVVALNRPSGENETNVLAKSEVEKLFEGLDVFLIEQSLGNINSLASEIWKVFVVIAVLALVIEALLCMPSPPVESVQ